MNGESGQIFNHEELYKALRGVEDLMDILLTPYFLLGKTAEDVKNNRQLEGEGIDVGIRNTALTQYVYDILKTNYGFSKEDVDNGFTFKVGEVPVRIKVYKRNYYFFKYPDTAVYEFGSYQIPNPFDAYWKSRFIVR